MLSKQAFFSPPKKLAPLAAIILPEGMIPLCVDMYEDPGKIVICEPNQKIFLFTRGLANCIAALLFCKLKSGKTIIGLSHIYLEEKDLTKSLEECLYCKLNEKEADDLIEDNNYVPHKLKVLLEKIQQYDPCSIDIYLAGGREEDELSKSFNKLLIAYVRKLNNIQFKGLLINPFDISETTWDKITFQFRYIFSLVAGITSDGIPLLSKTYDVSFNHGCKIFPDDNELKNYFKQLPISPLQSPPILGFQNLSEEGLAQACNTFEEQDHIFKIK